MRPNEGGAQWLQEEKVGDAMPLDWQPIHFSRVASVTCLNASLSHENEPRHSTNYGVMSPWEYKTLLLEFYGLY